MGVGLLIGLLIPALIIYLRRLLFPTFNDKEELQRVTQFP
jgi:capsular polysaccharide biosynthesis protein